MPSVMYKEKSAVARLGASQLQCLLKGIRGRKTLKSMKTHLSNPIAVYAAPISIFFPFTLFHSMVADPISVRADMIHATRNACVRALL
jgi:hypothetical protein